MVVVCANGRRIPSTITTFVLGLLSLVDVVEKELDVTSDVAAREVMAASLDEDDDDDGDDIPCLRRRAVIIVVVEMYFRNDCERRTVVK
jgi:hypothetical protein